MSFCNKVVLVTGGGSGIGAAVAKSFAKEGANVAIIDINETGLNNVSEQIRKIGKKTLTDSSLLTVKADVGKVEAVKESIKKTIDKYRKLDIVVNCAGIGLTANILDENLPEIYDKVMNANLKSIVLMTHFAAPHLIETKGNIVNISSIAGKSTISGMGSGLAAYCTSKAGVDHFSRVSALELADKGVRVNVISPGPVNTSIIECTGTTDWSPIVARTALKVLIQPEEIANMVLYLASDKAGIITGSNFVVDSGMSLNM